MTSVDLQWFISAGRLIYATGPVCWALNQNFRKSDTFDGFVLLVDRRTVDRKIDIRLDYIYLFIGTLSYSNHKFVSSIRAREPGGQALIACPREQAHKYNWAERAVRELWSPRGLIASFLSLCHTNTRRHDMTSPTPSLRVGNREPGRLCLP